MIDKKIVELVHYRAKGYCEICGKVAEPTMALHHRKLKSRGGKDSASNLVWIHHGCHNLDTLSVHNQPQKSKDYGYMVSSWQEPDETPFKCPDGTWVLLKNDGSLISLGEQNGTNHSQGQRW